jgi:hypothetical protein
VGLAGARLPRRCASSITWPDWRLGAPGSEGQILKALLIASALTTNVTAPADTPQWWLPHLFLQWRAGCAEACWLSREKLGLPFNALEPGKLAAY